MGLSCKPSAILLCISLAILLHSCIAQNTPQDFLAAHNTVRAKVGVAPIAWDATVAAFAQQYVNSRVRDCNFAHSGSRDYGENIALGSGEFTGRAAVELWAGEKHRYNHTANACVGVECRHYTQIVWKNSVKLGCARAQCLNRSWFISCNYSPPGNVRGQRPY